MPNIINLALPALLVLVALEVIADALMQRDLYETKDTATLCASMLWRLRLNWNTQSLQIPLGNRHPGKLSPGFRVEFCCGVGTLPSYATRNWQRMPKRKTRN